MTVAVAHLVHRLADCPDDFLAPPLTGQGGTVAVAAVVGDTFAGLGAALPEPWLASLAPAEANAGMQNWLRACLVACWLANDDAMRPVLTANVLLHFMADDLRQVADLVPADKLVADPDRREELARRLLRAAGVAPAGETREQAEDRLATLDSANRSRVEAEARAAEQRAREVRAALERRRAEAAAARASRE